MVFIIGPTEFCFGKEKKWTETGRIDSCSATRQLVRVVARHGLGRGGAGWTQSVFLRNPHPSPVSAFILGLQNDLIYFFLILVTNNTPSNYFRLLPSKPCGGLGNEQGREQGSLPEVETLKARLSVYCVHHPETQLGRFVSARGREEAHAVLLRAHTLALSFLLSFFRIMAGRSLIRQ